MNQNILTQMQEEKQRVELLSIRFNLRNPKRPETSLQCKIGINGSYATEFVVERKIKTNYWAQKLQKMMDDSPESALLNERLAFIKLEIKKAELRLKLEGKAITAKAVKAAFLNVHGHNKAQTTQETAKETRPTFRDCFTRFYDKKAAQKRKPVSDRTKESYWRYKSNLDKYMAFLRIRHLYVDQINYEWAENYLDWLIDTKGFTNDYANNNVQLLKSVFLMADNTGFIKQNPLKGFKLSDDDNYDTTHLTMHEVNLIANFDFTALPIHPLTAQSLRDEADCFIITCFTAQHHTDFHERGFELFVHQEDGRKWLRDNRNKTKTPYTLPVHPIALAIIEKYGGIDKLPVKANTKRNKLLKEIAAFCQIPKHLTTKIGRKTFTNYALNILRMREVTIAAILGHKSTKFIKRYARITEESIAAEYQFKQ